MAIDIGKGVYRAVLAITATANRIITFPDRTFTVADAADVATDVAALAAHEIDSSTHNVAVVAGVADITTHTAVASAHHSSTSNALAITPASVVSSGASTADRHTLGSDIAYPGAVKGIWNQAVLGLVVQGSGSGQDLTIVNRGGTTLIGVGPNTVTLGFFGVTPVVRPNVTGSRGGNAALASLLTSLAGLGLITDGTTA